MRYYHRQIGTVVVIGLTTSIAFLVSMLTLKGDTALIVPLASALVLIGVLFFSLTIQIDKGELKFWFGVGLIRKRIALTKIASCKVTTSSILYGWGIHLTLRGWLYNVSGFNAVEINLKDGKRFLLGSDEPHELCAALEKEINSSVKGKELR